MIRFDLAYVVDMLHDTPTQIQLTLDRRNAAALTALIGTLPVGPAALLYNALCTVCGDADVDRAAAELVG